MIKIKFVRINFATDPYQQLYYKYSSNGIFIKEFCSMETAAKFIKKIENSDKIRVWQICLPMYKAKALVNKVKHL